MAVTRLSPRDVDARSVDMLGLNSSRVDLLDPEAIAASVRRAAAVLCPATPRALVRAVSDAVEVLPGFQEEHRSEIEDMVDALAAYGDLLELELEDEDGRNRRHLFLGAPAFVRRATSCVLIGVRADGAPLVGEELAERIEYNAHVRQIRSRPSEDLADVLRAEDLLELTGEHWLRAPRPMAASDVLDGYGRRLDAKGPSGDIEDLRILDPASSVRYYRGRWRPPKRADTGDFVARRPQAFGADLWCFARLVEGRVMKLLDLPTDDPLVRGADEALRLQAAVDSNAGHPGLVRCRLDSRDDLAVIDFFAPLPTWAQRRLDAVSRPLPRARGALFSYLLDAAETDEELRFLSRMLWMQTTDEAEVAS